MRIDPPPSDAVPNGMIPAATAAELPPLEPPGVFVTSHGFRVMPNTLVLVKLSVPNSGLAVFPTGTAPATRKRATFRSSRGGSAPRERDRPERCRHTLAVL